MSFWPYVVEIKPHESLDGLFHGVLSLTENQPRSRWNAITFLDLQLAA